MSNDQIVAIWRAPFAEGAATKITFPLGGTISDMLDRMEFLPPDFSARGNILIGDHAITRRNWSRVKPKAGARLSFHYPLAGGGKQDGKKGKSGILSLVIAIAAIAASVFTLGGGFAFLGGSFAQGAFGAKLLAGAISLAGSLASAALTPPPTRPKPANQEQDKGAASANGNVLGAGAPIPRVIGTRKIFPSLVTQPFTYRDGQDELVEALFALAGPHDLQDIKIGDTLIDDAEDITYQIRNGWDGDVPEDLIQRYAVTKSPGIEMSTHDVVGDDQVELRNQLDPTKSLPRFHAVGAASSPDRIMVDLIMPQGLYKNTDTSNRYVIPFRCRLRNVSTGVIFNLPEMQYASNDSRQIRPTIEIVWRAATTPLPSPPNQEGWNILLTTVPAQAVPAMGGWQAHSSFYSGSGPTYLVNGNSGATGLQRAYVVDDTVTVELDEAQIPKGRYQVEVIRGTAFRASDFSKDSNYEFFGNVLDFFGYVLDGSTAESPRNRANMTDTVGLVRVSSVYDSHPVADGEAGSGLALIAVIAKNRQLENLSVEASGYVKDWDGTGWNNWITTSLPAPHYFDVLRGTLTPDAIDLDLIDNDSLVAWRQTCITESYTCDMICEGDPIADVLSRVASTGYARPRASETWGVIEDYDRSAEDPVQIFTSRNSSGITMSKAFARLPDAFRVVYSDNDGADQQFIVYRPGLESVINPRIEEVRYDGLKTEAASRKRALFDLMQGDLRSAFWSFSAPAEALVATRGDLIAVNHDIIDSTHASARITDVEIQSGNIIAVSVDSVLPAYNEPEWQDIVAVEDVEAFELIGAESLIGIRESDGLSTLHSISGATGNRSRFVFSTPVPVALDDDGAPLIRDDNLLWIGIGTATVSMRLIAFGIETDANLNARITAVDEAPELWAA